LLGFFPFLPFAAVGGGGEGNLDDYAFLDDELQGRFALLGVVCGGLVAASSFRARLQVTQAERGASKIESFDWSVDFGHLTN